MIDLVKLFPAIDYYMHNLHNYFTLFYVFTFKLICSKIMVEGWLVVIYVCCTVNAIYYVTDKSFTWACNVVYESNSFKTAYLLYPLIYSKNLSDK